MLKELRELGRLLGGRKPYDEIKADKVVVLEFDQEGRFLRAELEEFDSNKTHLYLHRATGYANPPSFTPTLPLNLKSPEKTLGNAQKALNKLRSVNPNLPELRLKDAEEELKNLLESVPKKEKVLLTVKVGGRYLGEVPEVKEALEKLVGQEGLKSKGVAVCSVCLEEKEVSGDASPFKFYTVDKPGYVAGGFDKKQAYKNFPLCLECKELIEAGRAFVERELEFKLAGRFTYLLIPELVWGTEELREELFTLFKNLPQKEHRLDERERKRLLSDEREVLDLLAQEKDYLTLNFLFLTKEQSAERVLLLLQEVYPSRLKKLFEIKEFVEKLLTAEGRPFTFTHKTAYFLFKEHEKAFLELLDKTFRGVPFDEKLLVRVLLEGVREALYEGSFYFRVKDAFGVFLFTLIADGEEEMKEVSTESLRAFVESLPALEDELKRGLFVLGALTERLLRVQERERKSKPFLKKLKSLKMTERDLKGLLPEVRNKLEEYGAFGRAERELYELASEYLSVSPPKWNMSVEELNFYFALGMGAFDKLAEILYKKEGER